MGKIKKCVQSTCAKGQKGYYFNLYYLKKHSIVLYSNYVQNVIIDIYSMWYYTLRFKTSF